MNNLGLILWEIIIIVVIVLMFIAPIGAVVWFVLNVVNCLKTPKGYRRSKRTTVIISGVTAAVLGYFFYLLLPFISRTVPIF